MKFAYIFLPFIFACLSLTASGHRADSVKLLSSATHSDSLKTNISDSLNFSVPFTHKDSMSSQTAVHHVYDINLSSLVKHADSVSLWEAPRLLGNLKEQVKAHIRDSLKQSIIIKQQDSLKFATYRFRSDSIKGPLKQMSLDSLKQQLTLPENEWLKGQIYTEIASRYLIYDTLTNRVTRLNYQNKALNYTMMALHQYSLFNDTLGLHICFDNLAKVYYAQKKYSQAKWFILQSNTLARAKNNVPDIISSLLTLSAIKTDIKDYNLAKKDLDEALQLSITNHYQKKEMDVLKSYAMLYSRLKNYPMESVILKKRDSIEENIRKDEEARLMAINLQALSQKRKLDSVQNKKKLYTLTTHKLYKNSSSKKMASL